MASASSDACVQAAGCESNLTVDVDTSWQVQQSAPTMDYTDQLCRPSLLDRLTAPLAAPAVHWPQAPGSGGAAPGNSTSEASDDSQRTAPLPQLPPAVRSPAAGPAPTPLPACYATGAALAGLVHSSRGILAAAHDAPPSVPVASQPPSMQTAASGGTGWEPASGHTALHIRVPDIDKRAHVPKRILSLLFGNRKSASQVIDLHLLAPGCRWLGRYVRQRSWDGLEILTAVRRQLQQHLQQATGERRCSTNIVVLQPMQHNGQLSDHALGVALLAARDATPAIEMEADERAFGYVVQRPQHSSQLPKRRRLAPAAAPASPAAASTWLTMGGSARAAAAAVHHSGDSAADLAAAGPQQQQCCPAPPQQSAAAARPLRPARQQRAHPAVHASHAPAGEAAAPSDPIRSVGS